jgi:putative lysine transport system permease protein
LALELNQDQVSLAIGVRKNYEYLDKINLSLDKLDNNFKKDLMLKKIKEQPELNKINLDNKKDNFGLDMINIIKDHWRNLLRASGMTLFISLVSTLIGMLIGLLIGVYKTLSLDSFSKIKLFFYELIDSLLNIYIEIFRGTPMMVQAAIIFYGMAQAFNINLNKTFAALIIVSINTGAYMSEIVRGGILSINKSQFDSANALGFKHSQIMSKIVLPQVIRNILPAVGNEFVINIKDTSVLNIIAVSELFFQAKSIAGSNFKFFQTYFIISIIYFVMTFIITRVLLFLEHRLKF